MSTIPYIKISWSTDYFTEFFFNKYVKRRFFHNEQVVEKDCDLSYFTVAIFILNSGILC